MLDQLIRAAFEECAQRRKFPPSPNADSIIAWIKQKDKGRYGNGNEE